MWTYQFYSRRAKPIVREETKEERWEIIYFLLLNEVLTLNAKDRIVCTDAINFAAKQAQKTSYEHDSTFASDITINTTEFKEVVLSENVPTPFKPYGETK